MEKEKIEELITLMEERNLRKIQIKEKDHEILLEKDSPHEVVAAPAILPTYKVEETATTVKEDGTFVTSPMVGIFYAAPAPDQPEFVQVGDMVTQDTVVCIIEAMKVMNEVKAGKAGKIVEIFIDNAQPVEFGTKLFRIE